MSQKEKKKKKMCLSSKTVKDTRISLIKNKEQYFGFK